MNTNHHDTFQTSDFGLATFIYASGIILETIDKADPRNAVFIFQKPPDDMLSCYQSGNAVANVHAIESARNTLLGMLRGQRLR